MLFYVLVEPWAVYVKESAFFESQNGLTEDWGKRWRPVFAADIESARVIGQGYREQNCLADRMPSINKSNFSLMGENRLRSELGSVCGLHGQEFARGCNACAGAFDARMSAKEELGRRSCLTN